MYISFRGEIQRNYADYCMKLPNGTDVEVCASSDDKAACRCTIDIVQSEDDNSKSTKIGEIDFWAYSVDACNLDITAQKFRAFDGEKTLYERMDEDCGDTEEYYHILNSLYSDIFIGDDYDDIIFSDLSIVALHRVYIEPEYRGQGIGKFIVNNLSKIIFDATNIKSLYTFGVVVPDDKKEETRKIQIKTMKDAGFTVKEYEDDYYVFGKCILDTDIV